MVAIVGLNGSGKSTLLRVLATLTIPDEGSARVFGHDVVSDGHEVRRHVNRVSVEASFFKEMSPWENLSYATRLYGRGGTGTREAAVAALIRLGLPRDTLDRPMKQLSRGQQQKVAIARSLLTSPSLLLMDEPTTGLDPRSKREVQGFVRDIRSQSGVTVLLSTHDLEEAERLCDRVVILDRGRILAEGTPAALRAAARHLRRRVVAGGRVPPADREELRRRQRSSEPTRRNVHERRHARTPTCARVACASRPTRFSGSSSASATSTAATGCGRSSGSSTASSAR